MELIVISLLNQWSAGLEQPSRINGLLEQPSRINPPLYNVLENSSHD